MAEHQEAPSGSLAHRIDAIEAAYEYMLAYAAQGRSDEPAGPGNIRDFLKRAEAALDGLDGAARSSAKGGLAAAAGPFIDVLAEDTRKALAAVRLALATRAITSQIVDTLNASIHLRALLTDLFLIDESLKD